LRLSWSFTPFSLLPLLAETELFWAKIGYAGTVAAPLAWAVFAVAYTGRDRWLAPRRLALVSVIPLVTLLLVLTNSAHQLVWSDPVLDRSGRSTGLARFHNYYCRRPPGFGCMPATATRSTCWARS
jgi:hypothetical protein